MVRSSVLVFWPHELVHTSSNSAAVEFTTRKYESYEHANAISESETRKYDHTRTHHKSNY